MGKKYQKKKAKKIKFDYTQILIFEGETQERTKG